MLYSHPLLSRDYTLIIPGSFTDELQSELLNIIQKKDSADANVIVSSYLKKLEKDFQLSFPQLHMQFRGKYPSKSTSSVRRVLNGKSIGASFPSYNLLELLCQIAFHENVISKLLNSRYNLEELYKIKIPSYARKQIKEYFENQPVSDTSTPIKNSIEEHYGIHVITNKMFEDLKTSDHDHRRDIQKEFYLKFHNSPAILKQIIANEDHVEPNVAFATDNGENIQEATLEHLLGKAKKGFPLLVKILNIGGSGKSTFLWHAMHALSKTHTVIYIERIKISSIVKYTQKVSPQSTLVFFLDKAVTSEENKKHLVELGETLSNLSLTNKIVLITSERAYRYTSFEQIKDFEQSFASNIYRAKINTEIIKEKIFEIIYHLLKLELSPEQYDFCYSIFNKPRTSSIIDRTFHLLTTLKRNNHIQDYTFDWEDWKNSCINRFTPISDLFKIVAFFYQFGISTPLEYINFYYRYTPGAVDLILELLDSTNMEAPIVMAENDKGKWVLQLRHEKLAEWYFKITPNGIASGLNFFDKIFLKDVSTDEHAYLFRKICRNHFEFNLSPYRQVLSNKRILTIADNYLEGKTLYGEEEFKMLMEKHFVLKNIGDKNCQEPLKKILEFDENNVRALTRLASEMGESNFVNKAEQLYQMVRNIPGEEYNHKATLNLLLLYYKHRSPFLAEYEQELFEHAAIDTPFALQLIDIIRKKINKTTHRTAKHLVSLYHQKIGLAFRIVRTLIKTKSYKETLRILIDLAEKTAHEKLKTRNRIARNLIFLYEQQNFPDNTSLVAAEQILNETKILFPKSGEVYFLCASLLLHKYPRSYKDAEKYIQRAYELEPTNKMFFSICRFYRDFASSLPRIKIPTSTVVLLKAASFIQSVVSTSLADVSAFKIEQIIVLNKLIDNYFFHSLNNNRKLKYQKKIQALESVCETLFIECHTIISKRLPTIDKELFTNYMMDENSLKSFTKLCSVKCNFYKAKAYRLDRLPEFLNTKVSYLLTSKEAVESALSYDLYNITLNLNLIEIRVFLKDKDPIASVENRLIGEFPIKEKARLYSLLLRHGYKEVSIELIKKMGQLDSTDYRIKNDLAYCYIEAGLWKYALNVLSELRYHHKFTIKLLRRLAFEMPIITEQRALDCIRICQILLKVKKHSVSYLMIRRILELLFISSRRKDCFDFFKKHMHSFKEQLPQNISHKKAFDIITLPYYGSLLKYLKRQVFLIEKKIIINQNFEKNIKILESFLNNLLSLKFDFKKIDFNVITDDVKSEDIKIIMFKTMDLFFTFFDRGDANKREVLRATSYLFEKYHNPFFIKVFIKKLIIKANLDSNKLFDVILNNIQTSELNDSDITRLLGRYYLMRKKFVKSKTFLNKASATANTKLQKLYVMNNLVDWSLTKIEVEGIKSFGSKYQICIQIQKVKTLISRCKKLDNSFKFILEAERRLQIINKKFCYQNL